MIDDIESPRDGVPIYTDAATGKESTSSAIIAAVVIEPALVFQKGAHRSPLLRDPNPHGVRFFGIRVNLRRRTPDRRGHWLQPKGPP